MTTAQSERVTPGDFGRMGRRTARILCDLINDHGVRYRIDKSGMHVYLYDGQSQTRPYKIAISRPEETTLRFLGRWIEEKVPEYGQEDSMEREVTPEVVERLAAVVNTTQRDDGWEKVKFGLERREAEEGYDYRCTVKGCDFTRTSLSSERGLHLHELSAHSPERDRAAIGKKAGETRSLRMSQRRANAEAAVEALAEYFKVDAGKAAAKLAKAEAEIEKLKAENEELKAKMSLLAEAFKGVK